MVVRRGAGVEVLSGVGAFALALLTWTFWFFAPVQMVQHYPNLAVLILAFLVATEAVAVGACLYTVGGTGGTCEPDEPCHLSPVSVRSPLPLPSRQRVLRLHLAMLTTGHHR